MAELMQMNGAVDLLKLNKMNSIILLIILNAIFLVSCSSNARYDDAHFIHYNTSFFAEKGSDYKLSIAYLNKKGFESSIVPSEVASISFNNSENVRIEDFNFYDSPSTDKYDVRNIELNLHFIHTGAETLNELKINFSDGSYKSYPIGNWYFEVENKDSLDKSPITMGEDFAIVSAFFDGYMVNLINQGDSDVAINDIHINLDKVAMDRKGFQIDSKGNLQEIITAKNEDPSYKFYIIRPRIEYVYNGEQHSYYPYASLYGTIKISEQDFDNEYLKSTFASESE
jgi:hypothetical protein